MRYTGIKLASPLEPGGYTIGVFAPIYRGSAPMDPFSDRLIFFFRIDFILLLFFFPGIGYLPFHARGVENEIWGEILGEEIIDRDSIVGRRFFEATMIKILSNVKILKKREYWIV